MHTVAVIRQVPVTITKRRKVVTWLTSFYDPDVAKARGIEHAHRFGQDRGDVRFIHQVGQFLSGR